MAARGARFSGAAATRALAELARLRSAFGPEAAARKLHLLAGLGHARLGTARAVAAFHDELLFLRAFPDDAAVLARCEVLLSGFAQRADLRRHAEALADSGIAGTDTFYHFFQPTAAWLARRFPGRLEVDWENTGEAAARSTALERLLPLLAHYAETPALDDVDLGSPRAWLERMAGKASGRGGPAALLLAGLDALPADDAVREYLYERLELALVLRGAPGAPSRTAEHHATGPVVFRTGALSTGRPALAAALAEQPRAVRFVNEREGAALVDLARGAMVARARDLDVFAWGDSRDVRLVDWGGGLAFAVIGFRPERRLLLEAVYGLLTLRNGVPVGYVLFSAFNQSSEIAYNVFPNFRGSEAAAVYVRALATARLLFGSDTFTVYPYQLGADNDEALDSGAWWFYQKLGFRPKELQLLALMRRELAAMRRKPGHRSTRATLVKLSAANVYYHLGRPRRDVIGLLDTGALGLRVTDALARRWGADRPAATAECEAAAAAALGLRHRRGWSPGERLLFTRWAPLILLLDVQRWSPAERRALVAIVRAKGGRRESEYIALSNRHRKLQAGIRRLAR